MQRHYYVDKDSSLIRTLSLLVPNASVLIKVFHFISKPLCMYVCMCIVNFYYTDYVIVIIDCILFSTSVKMSIEAELLVDMVLETHLMLIALPLSLSQLDHQHQIQTT